MLHLSDIFQSHMTLQMDKPIRIFGTADPCAAVNAVLLYGHTADSPSASAQGNALQDGSFLLELPPQEAGTGFTLSVTGGNESVRFYAIHVFNNSALIILFVQIFDVVDAVTGH